MFRIAVLFKNGETAGKNFPTRDKGETWLLTLKNIKKARLINKETGETETIWEDK